MTELYEQINDSIAAVGNWSNFTWYGVILGQKTFADFDTQIAAHQAASEWGLISKVKRETEFAGYSSSTIDTAVKAFLLNYPMFTNYKVPKTDTGPDYFKIGSPTIHGNRWSQELNYQTSKWDAEDCFDGIHYCFDTAGNAFEYCNPDTGGVTIGSGGRLYERNQLACTFWDLWQGSGVADAKTDIKQCWTYNQNNWLTSDPPHYKYAVSLTNWVWDGVPDMLQAFGRFQKVDHDSLANFSRIYTHMGPGYLDSKWESKHWKIDGGTTYEVAVHHNPDNNQRRLHGTFITHAFLHQAWNHMTTTQQGYYRDMLKGTGVTQAYDTILSATAGLFDSGTDKFKKDSDDGATTDEGTVWGATLLFILGICPETGSLAIPLRTQSLGQRYMVGPKSFRWDGDNHKIRIAVFAGKLTFMYGSSDTDYTFPRDGVYEVWFSDDYTQINKVVQINRLPGKYYLDYPVTEHKLWSRILKSFQAKNYVSTVTHRQLVLSAQRDRITGWYEKTWVENDIEAVVVPSGASMTSIVPGTYSTTNCTLYTASSIRDGDQVIYATRYYEVAETEPVNLGDSLVVYRCRIKQLPLYEA